MLITLPISGFVSVICLTILRLPCHGVQVAPSLAFGLVELALFLLGKLHIGDEFLHIDSSLWFLRSVYHRCLWVARCCDIIKYIDRLESAGRKNAQCRKFVILSGASAESKNLRTYGTFAENRYEDPSTPSENLRFSPVAQDDISFPCVFADYAALSR